MESSTTLNLAIQVNQQGVPTVVVASVLGGNGSSMVTTLRFNGSSMVTEVCSPDGGLRQFNLETRRVTAEQITGLRVTAHFNVDIPPLVPPPPPEEPPPPHSTSSSNEHHSLASSSTVRASRSRSPRRAEHIAGVAGGDIHQL